MAPIVLVRKRATGGGPPVAAPVNIVAPVASGTGTVGQLLSTTDGTWTGTPVIAFTYQWQRDGVDIGGATANTYTLVTADGGTSVRCVVTGTNGVGSSSANSNAIAVSLTYAQTVLADSPIRYWKLNEASGVNAADSSGNAATATYLNSPTLGSTPGPIAGETAMTVASASDQLVLRDSESLAGIADTFTIEMWIKRNATQGTQQFLFDRNNTADTPKIFIGTDNKLDFESHNAASLAISSSAITDTASWHHLVFTKSGATSKIYVDGVDVTVPGSNATCVSSTGRIYISRNFSVGFNGSMAQFAIYATALSAARVLAHYNAR